MVEQVVPALEEALIQYAGPGPNVFDSISAMMRKCWQSSGRQARFNMRPPLSPRATPRQHMRSKCKIRPGDMCMQVDTLAGKLVSMAMHQLCRHTYRLKQHVLREVLRRPYSSVFVYYVSLSLAHKSQGGPHGIYARGYLHSVTRFVAWRPRHIPWLRILDDVLFVCWALAGVVRHWQARFRVHPALKSVLQVLSPPQSQALPQWYPFASSS